MSKIIRPYKKEILCDWKNSEYKYYKDPVNAIHSLIPTKEKIDHYSDSYRKPKQYKIHKIHHMKIENAGNLLRCEMHPLIQAANYAFFEHLPLILTPDIIWYCISNAVAIHINLNAEKLRKTFVKHEGKKDIELVRPDFNLNKENPWNEVIEDLSDKIIENTSENVIGLLQADFTTTTEVSRLVSQIVIMDSMQNYFKYIIKGGCGIPEIRLNGEKHDWIKLKAKANKLVEIIAEFKEWIVNLNEILDQFIDVFDNKIDNFFWKSIYMCKL